MGSGKYEIVKKGGHGACPSPLPPEVNELGNALKTLLGYSDADLEPVRVCRGTYLDVEEGEKAK
ncbi:MAG TPA: hypothetical protein VLX12_04830 [Syntrophorhabdales bacterium]|nr:hypothetical protein [Syntrophorhabdales bacterium]